MTLMMRPSVLGPTGTEICAPVSVTLAAGQAVGRVHGDGAHGVFTEVLGDFEHQAVAVVVGFQRREDRRQFAFEGHVDDGADDLADVLAAARPSWWGSWRRWPWSFPCLLCVLERFGARDDFDQFGGDRGLAAAVVLDGQLVDQSPALRVALSIAVIEAPCSDACVFQQRAEQLGRDSAAAARRGFLPRPARIRRGTGCSGGDRPPWARTGMICCSVGSWPAPT
jgi:hypothetical protein